MRRVVRVLAWSIGGLAVLLLAVGVGGWFLLDRIDLAGIAGRRASVWLGREVRFAGLHVTPGTWITVEARDARLANIAGGSRPSMVRAGLARAEVQAWPLLHGALVLRGARIEELDALFERVAGTGPNWRFPPTTPEPPLPGQPVRLGDFPDLRDLVVSGTVAVRDGSGAETTVGLDRMAFTSPGLDQPVTLAGPGTYNGLPVTVDGALGSIAQYRRTAEPFPMRFSLTSGRTVVRFDGAMGDPVNLDGAKGAFALEAPTPAVLGRLAGVDGLALPPVRLESGLEHAGPDWRWTGVKGTVGQSRVKDGTVHLVEGVRTEENAPPPPDRLSLDLALAELHIEELLGGGGGNPSLAVPTDPGLLLQAHVKADQVTTRTLLLQQGEIAAAQEPGKITVSSVSFGSYGGRVSGAGTLEAKGAGGTLSAKLQASKVAVDVVAALLGRAPLPLSGAMEVHAEGSATGATLGAALRDSRASVVVTMAGGSVAKQVIELGSTDARTLFRSAEGSVPMRCLLLALDVRNGLGGVSPIRVRTAAGTVEGHGTVDLVRRRVDLTVESEGRTTGFFALDVPMHVTGPFSDLSFAPADLSARGRAQAASGDLIARLLPGVQAAARGSSCLGR